MLYISGDVFEYGFPAGTLHNPSKATIDFCTAAEHSWQAAREAAATRTYKEVTINLITPDDIGCFSSKFTICGASALTTWQEREHR